jgi:two-component system, LytTR family, response regulator
MKAIIIDDEQEPRETMEVFLREYCPQIKLVGKAENGESGLVLIKKTHPDIIFLDVQMPDMSGFELLKRLGNTTALVVFVTAYQKYAEQAFEFAALDFLRKPIEPIRLIKAVHRATERHQYQFLQEQYRALLEMVHQGMNDGDPRMQSIVFATKTEMLFKRVGMIVYIEAQSNACNIKLIDETAPIYIYKTLRDYDQQLDAMPFMMRVHHSYIVNLYHVKKFIREDFVLIMTDGSQVSLSESKKVECLERLGNLGVSME